MSRKHSLMLAGIGVTVFAGAAAAQIVITDPAVTIKNTIVATLRQQVLDTATQQAAQIRRMARRLSAFADLSRYAISDDDTPKWRIHVFFGDEFLYANPYNAALNYGDRDGAAFEEVARQREMPGAELSSFGEEGLDTEAAIAAQLATLDAADSSIIAATDQTGQLRYNGRKELAAIEALETDTLDPSLTQGSTAVLDKISGAGLIRARQQQARIQFMTGIVEQLLVDNKRARDTEASAMNMQLQRLLYGRTAGASLVAGAANDLRSWKQP